MISFLFRNSNTVILALLFNLAATGYLRAQTLPVGIFSSIEEAYRREQLLGKDSSFNSYMIRPIQLSNSKNMVLDQSQTPNLSLGDFRKELYKESKRKIEVYALPLVLQQQINTHHPYGMNDGGMIQAKGYQTQISAGIFAKIGPLSIQFRPEFVYAQNSKFTTIQDINTSKEFKHGDFLFQNRIDNPERYGEGTYSKASWGQSSIRLTFDPVSFGFSTENLWWGPGVKNSLLMTNNATGFRHLTLNTSRPVNIYIGHLEAQVVGGRLENSGIPTPTSIYGTASPKNESWRYFSGFVMTYQPKWVPNLFLGLDRSFVVYRSDMGNSLGDYLPFFGALSKEQSDESSTDGVPEDSKKRDQYISVFARYVLPESKAEIYFQYGKNDHSYNFRDLFTKLDHTRAYVVGFRKLVPLNKKDEYIQIETEVTQLAKPSSENKNRNGQSWYAHYQVRHGYTHLGQVLGAGIGPGSNMQSADISWVKGLKKIGLGIDRTDHNNDLYYQTGTTDTRRHWVDLGVRGMFNWTFNKLVVNSQLSYIHSFNYHYALIQAPDAFAWDWEHQDANNMQIKIGLLYKL